MVSTSGCQISFHVDPFSGIPVCQHFVRIQEPRRGRGRGDGQGEDAQLVARLDAQLDQLPVGAELAEALLHPSDFAVDLFEGSLGHLPRSIAGPAARMKKITSQIRPPVD